MTTAASEQRTVHYTGAVQGVGFRYTTHRLASGFRVVGTVRNLSDGRVELVAEGDSAELDQFLDAVRTRFGGNIRDEHSETQPATRQHTSFEIIR